MSTEDTLDRAPRVLQWRETGFATAPDGTSYAIFDDWSRGEARVYRACVDTRAHPDNWPRWRPVSEWRPNKQTAKNEAERHARAHHAETSGP